MSGMFICVEGPDGCGKSSIIERLEETIKTICPVTTVADPGGSPFATACRKILLDATITDCDELQQVLLFTAARRSLAASIRVLLDSGYIVLSGRWVWSTYAYQGAMQGVPAAIIEYLHKTFINLDPAITILLDVSPEKAMERMLAQRGEQSVQNDRFESMSIEKRQQLRAGYFTIASENNSRIIGTDPLTLDGVYTQVTEILNANEQFVNLVGKI